MATPDDKSGSRTTSNSDPEHVALVQARNRLSELRNQIADLEGVLSTAIVKVCETESRSRAHIASLENDLGRMAFQQKATIEKIASLKEQSSHIEAKFRNEEELARRAKQESETVFALLNRRLEVQAAELETFRRRAKQNNETGTNDKEALKIAQQDRNRLELSLIQVKGQLREYQSNFALLKEENRRLGADLSERTESYESEKSALRSLATELKRKFDDAVFELQRTRAESKDALQQLRLDHKVELERLKEGWVLADGRNKGEIDSLSRELVGLKEQCQFLEQSLAKKREELFAAVREADEATTRLLLLDSGVRDEPKARQISKISGIANSDSSEMDL